MALPFISINFSALKSESVLIKDSVAIPAVCARVSLGKFIVVTGKYSQGSNTIKHKQYNYLNLLLRETEPSFLHANKSRPIPIARGEGCL